MADPEYDAVVVGAGLLGCSAALHLSRRGLRRVAVVDIGAPGAATSGAGAGFVGAWAAGYTAPGTCAADELVLETYGIEFYRGLAVHRDLGLRANGNLFLARTEQGYAEHVESIRHHPLAPADIRDVSPAQVAELSGGSIDAAQVYRGVLHPSGIQLDTTPTVAAIADLLRESGVELHTGMPVTNLLGQAETAVTGVGLASGTLRARTTVLATGAWVNDLLAGTGVHLPIAREVATRVITPPSGVSPAMPTVMVPELQWLWAREHLGGLTYGNVAGYAFAHTLGPHTATGGRPHHPDLVEAMVGDLAPELGRLFPEADVSVAQWRQGVVSHTPDGLFYAGPVPGRTGLFALAGCNEGGVTHGPGLGRVIADLVLDSGTDWVDADRYRLDRFPDLAGADDATVSRNSRH